MRQSPPERPRLRKREIVLAVAAGAVAAGGAGLLLSGNDPQPTYVAVAEPSELDYQLSDFDEISTTGPQDVVVTLGDTFSIRSEGSPRALSLLEPVVENGRLTIGPRRGFNWGNWRRLDGATFYVTLPALKGVAVAGSGNVRIDQVEGDSFEGTIAGSGALSIVQMTVDNADFNIGGGGNIAAAGTARETRVAIGGSGDVDAVGLRSETASVSIGGSGNVSLAVDEDAKVSIMGSGDVNIIGPARCSVTRFGSGNVRCDGGGGTSD